MQKKQVGTPNFTVKENDSLSSPSGLCVCKCSFEENLHTWYHP